MKNKLLLCTLAAALVASGFTASKASAADPATPAARYGKLLQSIAEKLNLTDEQKAQIKTVFAGEKEQLKPLLMTLQAARAHLRKAIHAADANETSVRAAAATVASAEADLAVERLKLFGKIAPILTEEQRQKISELESRWDAGRDH